MKFVNEDIETYAINHSNVPGVVARELAEKTREVEPMSQMLIGPMEGSLFGFLARAIKAQKVLEIGTFTGYSALVFAENLPEDGEVHTLDLEEKSYTKEFWNKAGLEKKINLHLGDARKTLTNLKSSFDIIFIDADKSSYPFYLERGLELLSANGIIILDNVLWSGKVLEKEINSDDSATKTLKQINSLIKEREDLYGTLLPIRDGIFLIKKI